jgi:hypothetical protein
MTVVIVSVKSTAATPQTPINLHKFQTAESRLSAEHHSGAGGEAATESHERGGASAEGSESGHRARATARHHESPQHGQPAGAVAVRVRALVLRHALPHVLPGLLHRHDLLLSQRRGEFVMIFG